MFPSGGTVLNQFSILVLLLIRRHSHFILQVLFPGLDLEFHPPPLVLCLLYSTFVLPLFNYCDVVWSPRTYCLA